MADKLIIKDQKIFANSGNYANVIAKFGSYKGGEPSYSDDPDVIQGYTGATGHTGLTGQNAWSEGWFAAVDNNLCPTIQDMNAFFYVVTRQIKQMMESGLPEWISTINYCLGSFVRNSDGIIFISLVDNNLNNVLSDTSKWMVYWPNKVHTKGTNNNYTVAYDDYIIRCDGTTSDDDKYVFLPTASAAYENRVIHIVVLNCNPTYPITCEGITIKKWESATFICDGATWRLWDKCYL